MFEKNIEKDSNIGHKISNLTLKENSLNNHEELRSTSIPKTETDSKEILIGLNINMDTPEKVYKTNINKFNFLQTQLCEEPKHEVNSLENLEKNSKDCVNTIDSNVSNVEEHNDTSKSDITENSNVTDDNRIANSVSEIIELPPLLQPQIEEPNVQEATICVPPRRKKQNAIDKALALAKEKESNRSIQVEYPDHLNPFSDDEDGVSVTNKLKVTAISISERSLTMS